jgi:hypothetical protein
MEVERREVDLSVWIFDIRKVVSLDLIPVVYNL